MNFVMIRAIRIPEIMQVVIGPHSQFIMKSAKPQINQVIGVLNT